MLFAKLETEINSLDSTSISFERKQVLQPLIDYVQSKIDSKQAIYLNFICTHNSRRSHLAQVWAQAMACHFHIKKVHCFSGGTEATALFPMVVKTLQNSGFKIERLPEGDNSKYSITYAVGREPIIGFSKTYDDDLNPKLQFAAIMTCSQADAGCPFIPGTEKRISITYDDPKVFDNTPKQTEKYKERSMQIATELKYIFSKLNASK